MKALSYLLVTQLKNRILSLRKKPGFLILYSVIFLVVLASIIVLIFFGDKASTPKFADERILFMIIGVLGLFFLYAFTTTGLSTGSSLFTMPDVGLLFVAPISSKKILMYGLISSLGKALFGSIFIFYQVGNLKTNFGYGFLEILSLFIIFTLMTLFCQLISIGIYIFSNGNQTRKNLVKSILYAFLGIIILVTLLLQRQSQVSILEAALRVISSRWFGFIPVAGWSTMLFIGIVKNSIISVVLSLLLYGLTGALVIYLLTVGKADYYEDVLLSTEVTYQTRQAAKEGRNIPRASNKKIKVKSNEPGIDKGRGAMTFFYKHMLELRRKSRFVYLDSFTMFAIIGLGIAGYNFKTKNAPEEVYYITLSVAVYLQFFLTIMGKLKIELQKPYIYLIPESPMKKLFAASLTSLVKPFVDGICIFIVFAVISGKGPIAGFLFALAYGASGAVFTGLTILYQRILGGQPNRIVQMFIGAFLLVAILAPSVGASVAAAYLLPENLLFLCTLPYSLFCLLFTALIFICCRNLIDKAEYTGK